MFSKVLLMSILSIFFAGCSTSVEDETESTETANTHANCCVQKDTSENKNQEQMQSEITCPNCGYKKMETMPTDICLIKYTCENCHTEMQPKSGDCCVFCTHGTHKCPSMQND